ncbi:hypothetical protein [Spiroplasma endosymbiont of Lasioglossum malachurum]|uniref:hypothetical protein n=1 Tax=Spiroplasma endosymbiont of Lasioglossum malachurum TaxID=3066319 RepID=UPI0030CED154
MISEKHICASHKPNKCIVANYQYQLEQFWLTYLNEIYNQGIKDYFNEKIKENKMDYKEKIKIRIHEFELYDYQVNTLLDIVREMLKANKGD